MYGAGDVSYVLTGSTCVPLGSVLHAVISLPTRDML